MPNFRKFRINENLHKKVCERKRDLFEQEENPDYIFEQSKNKPDNLHVKVGKKPTEDDIDQFEKMMSRFREKMSTPRPNFRLLYHYEFCSKYPECLERVDGMNFESKIERIKHMEKTGDLPPRIFKSRVDMLYELYTIDPVSNVRFKNIRDEWDKLNKM